MARQTMTPVQFNRTVRKDTNVLMSSGRAGVVVPAGFCPLLPGDGCSGKFGIDIELAEMPKPLENTVQANVQAWFVPKSSHPQFPGRDELMHSMTGDVIKALGAADRTPPTYFTVVAGGGLTTVAASDFFKTLGLHIPAGSSINSDLMDAFSVIYNFRLAAHSSKLTASKRAYYSESAINSVALSPAFWPSGRLANVVADYEAALILGNLDLDVLAGQLPVTGFGFNNGATSTVTEPHRTATGLTANAVVSSDSQYWNIKVKGTTPNFLPDIFAEMAGQSVNVTLADIDKARTTQAFAKLRTAYAGNDATGFDNDDTIVALLMQGISVPQDQFKRPWLLDSKRVTFGMAERHATDAANLDVSVTRGRASALLSLNVPVQDVGGIIIFTVEVLPDRLYERMSDEWLRCTTFDDLPNALRDIQRPLPVDEVPKRRVDAKHTTPNGVYGFEPMNDKWNRDFTRLGGDYYQATPGTPFTEARNAIWQCDIVDPEYDETHFLAPAPFPHEVFADAEGSAFKFVARHAVAINGLTQIGDVLAESNDDYDVVVDAGT